MSIRPNLRNCAHDASYTPQALPRDGSIGPGDPITTESFDGSRVSYSQFDASRHQVNRYPSDRKPRQYSSLVSYPGRFDLNIVCDKGMAGIDGKCVCPGSADQMPFNSESAGNVLTNKMLFDPFLPGSMPQLTPAAQHLVNQRSPLPPGVGRYYSLD